MKLEQIIEELIQKQKIYTQQELVEILTEKGRTVTQSNISRILIKIKANKAVDKQGKIYYVLPAKNVTIDKWVKNLINSIEYNEVSVLIKTHPGYATGIAQIIDEQNLSSILGSVAGDDAIAIYPKTTKKVKQVSKELKELLLV